MSDSVFPLSIRPVPDWVVVWWNNRGDRSELSFLGAPRHTPVFHTPNYCSQEFFQARIQVREPHSLCKVFLWHDMNSLKRHERAYQHYGGHEEVDDDEDCDFRHARCNCLHLFLAALNIHERFEDSWCNRVSHENTRETKNSSRIKSSIRCP